LKKILLSFIGIFALVAGACLAAPPGALASDGLFIDNQNVQAMVIASVDDGGSAVIKPDPGDIMALSVTADGLRSCLTTLNIEERGIITPDSKLIGGAISSAYSKPGRILTNLI